jgi:trehalose 6-phosphate phosphatase
MSSSSSSHPGQDASDFQSKPNILNEWSSIAPQLRDKEIAVFLDYDGTLTPIVSNPSDAKISDDMRSTVDQLSKRWNTAVITGRRMEVISSFLRLPELHYGASHGFDVYGPHEKPLHAAAHEYLPSLQKFRDAIHARIAHIKGSLVEDAKYSISVHYRNVASPSDAQISEAVDEELNKINSTTEYKLKKHGGKKVWEIKPDFQWNKGKAVEYLINLLYDKDKQKNLIPVYLGDDVTDEDAFKVLNNYPDSLSVFVINETTNRPTHAKYTVQDQQQVRELLERLSKL